MHFESWVADNTLNPGSPFVGLMVKQKWRDELASSSTSSAGKRAKGPSTSHLVDWILNEVYWERLPWTKAQSCAHAAILDGLTDSHLKEIASLGQFGFYEENESRDSKQLSILEEARHKSPPDYEFDVLAFSKKNKGDFQSSLWGHTFARLLTLSRRALEFTL